MNIEKQISGDEASKWFQENTHWLVGWLDCFVDMPESEGDQCYYRHRDFYLDGPPAVNRPTLKEISEHLAEVVNAEFIPMALCSLVFGMKTTLARGDGSLSYTIDGFYAQTGRLPTKEDRVRIHASEYGPVEQRESADTLTVYRCWRISRLEITTEEKKPKSSLLSAAKAALAQLEHLHSPNKCLAPGNCPTLHAIEELRAEIGLAEIATAEIDIESMEALLSESSKMHNEGTRKWRYDEGNSVVWNGAGGGAAHHVTKSAGKLIEAMRNSLPSLIAIVKPKPATASEATYPPMTIEDLDSGTAHAILRAQGGIGR